MRAWWLVLVVAACSFHRESGTGDGMIGDGSGDAQADAATDAPGDAAGPFAPCAPLPPASNPITVSTIAALRSAIASAPAGATIEIADGTYDLSVFGGGTIAIARGNLTIRSASGMRQNVVFDGRGVTTPLFAIAASNVTIASIAFQHSGGGSAIYIQPVNGTDITNDVVYDVQFVDADPAVWVLPGDANNPQFAPYADGGTFACSQVAADKPLCAGQTTLGFHGVAIRNWVVRDNSFDQLACGLNLTHAILIESGSRDVSLLRNVLVDANQNIQLGGPTALARTYTDTPPLACGAVIPQFWGGLACDNSIGGVNVPNVVNDPQPFDQGIALWTACDTWVMHNTIVSPVPKTFSDLEYRFAGTYAHLVNNLVGKLPTARDAMAMADSSFITSNVLYSALGDFADAPNADFHLVAGAPEMPGSSIAAQSQCTTDADGKPRPLSSPMVGAFEK